MSKAIIVELSRDFLRDLKRLRKKYPSVRADLQPLITELEHGRTPGDQVPGVKYTVFKARLASTDMRRGKRGGFRVIYYIVVRGRVVLLTIYAKSQQEDITIGEMRDLIASLPDTFHESGEDQTDK